LTVLGSMRIAISGSHRTGKSTLLEELSERLRLYSTVEEPYFLLEEEGYSFATPPTLEDYEAQLERSLECMKLPGRDILFDRCPVDFLGYAMSHENASMFDIEEWLPRVRSAVRTLQLVVFVPLNQGVGKRIHEERRWRLAVDERLQEILVENALGIGVEVLEVRGSLEERIRQVLDRVQ